MIRQLVITLDNRPGTLKACVGQLADAGVDIKALEVTERGDGKHGDVHLIASDIDKAIAALDAGGYEYLVDDVLAVEMDDRVGGLAAILDLLATKDINLRYLYAFITRVRGKSLAVFSVRDTQAAAEVLREAGVPFASKEDFGEDDGKYKFKFNLEDHFGKDFIW